MKTITARLRLASAPRTPIGDFHQELAALARRLLASTIGISPADRQFLQDLARTEVRYPMNTLRRLNRIAACSVRPEDRDGPAELVRRDILANLPGMAGCLATAFDAENSANDAADAAQWRFWRAFAGRSLTSASFEETELSLTQQMVTTRDAIDVVRSLRTEVLR